MSDAVKQLAHNKTGMAASTKTALSSQVQISDDEIKTVISNVLGGVAVQEIRYLSYAFTNKTILARLEGQIGNVVIKICVKEDRFPKLQLEADLIERVSRETDIPVPDIIHKDFSRKKFKYPFIIYSFLPGENLTDSIIRIEDKKKLGTELGKVAGQLHKITFEKPQFSLASDENHKNWTDIIETICKKGTSKLRGNNYSRTKEIEEYIQNNILKIIEPKEYSLIHRDLQPQNIHWDNKTEKIVGVFDFESAMSGDSHFEFNFLERKLFKTYPEVREAFYKSYSNHNQLYENYKEIIKFYEIVRDLYFYDRDIHYGELDRANEDLESIERIIFNDWQVG